MEKSTNTLPFLDMELKIRNNNLQSWIWRKPTHTGVFLNFKAICPLKWKSNLISCMLNVPEIFVPTAIYSKMK